MSHLLYLMRHGQSADKQPGQADKARELTQQGMHDVLSIGRYLYHQKINLDLILSSMAIRAKRSAELIMDASKGSPDKIQLEEELYTASVRTFLELVNQQDDAFTTIMCVGHNPVISYLAEYLTKEVGDLPPAGLAIIQCNVLHWKDVNQGSGKLVNLITPDNLNDGN